jgi:predicted transcriptional regulator
MGWVMGRQRNSAPFKDRSGALAGRTSRTRSVLVAEAVADFGKRELAIIKKVECGRADVRAGRVVPHEVVSREAREIIEAVRTGP